MTIKELNELISDSVSDEQQVVVRVQDKYGDIKFLPILDADSNSIQVELFVDIEDVL